MVDAKKPKAKAKPAVKKVAVKDLDANKKSSNVKGGVIIKDTDKVCST